MNWSALWSNSRYDELVVDDIAGVVHGTHEFLKRRGIPIGVNKRTHLKLLMEYVWRRQKASALLLKGPVTRPRKPAGWEERNELIWQQWIHHVCSLDAWLFEVMYPVFGKEERIWEAACPGWREELFWMIDQWSKRSLEQFAEIDPTSIDDTDEDTDSDVWA
jgi:hypothetical protein